MKNFNTIEKYLAGEMSEEERSSFESKLRTDAKLAKEFKLHRLEQTAIAREGKQKRQKMIAQLLDQNPAFKDAPVIKPVFKKSYLYAVAAALLLLLAAYFVFLPHTPMADKAIAEQFYDNMPPSAIGSTRSEAGNYTEFLWSVQEVQKKKGREINKAIQFLNTVDPSVTYYPDAVYWLGHAYFKEGNYSSAEVLFTLVQSVTRRTELTQAADFYLLLSYLAMEGQSVRFQELALRIKGQDSHAYQQKAIELSQILSKNK